MSCAIICVLGNRSMKLYKKITVFHIDFSHIIQHKLEKYFNFPSFLPKMFFNALLETFIHWHVLKICITHQYKVVNKGFVRRYFQWALSFMVRSSLAVSLGENANNWTCRSGTVLDSFINFILFEPSRKVLIVIPTYRLKRWGSERFPALLK